MVRCRQKKLKLKLNTVFQVHGEIYRSITPFFCLLRLSLSNNISELTDSKFNHTVSKKTEMHLFVSFFCYLPQFTHDCESFPLTRQMEEAKIFNLSPLLCTQQTDQVHEALYLSLKTIPVVVGVVDATLVSCDNVIL